MLKKVTVLLLIVSMISANFSRLFVYAGFELNRGYIAAKLCENRDKPWMHCNGKCYFAKKIKQAEEKERSDERQSQKNLFQEAFFTEHSLPGFYPQIIKVMPVPARQIILPVVHLPIFQPPQLG